MNLAHSLLGNQPVAVRADVDRGKLSPQALTPAFIGLDSYPFHRAPTGVPALDRLEKGAARQQLQQPRLHRRLAPVPKGRGGVHQAPPGSVRCARSGTPSARCSCPRPTSSACRSTSRTSSELRGALDFENDLLGQRNEYQPPAAGRARDDHRARSRVTLRGSSCSPTPRPLLAAAFVVSVRSIRRRRWSAPGATLVFLAFVVTFSMFASNMFELGENMRFRLETDPLVFAAIGRAVGAGVDLPARRTGLASRPRARDHSRTERRSTSRTLDESPAGNGPTSARDRAGTPGLAE